MRGALSCKAFLVSCLLLAGCASAPSSYTDTLGTGYAMVDAVARTTEQLCASPTIGGPCEGALSTETRDQVRGELRLALELLDESRKYAVDGSADIAYQRAAQAQAILTTLTRVLQRYEQ